ncbi:MAG: HEAT repeat domain-containing protein, partial [Candidatus Micrarchaeota archaeon]
LYSHDQQSIREAAQKLSDIGEQSVHPLIEVIENTDWAALSCRIMRGWEPGDWDHASAAIWALGEIGDPQGAPSLIEALKHGDLILRNCARDAIFAIGDPAVPALMEAFRGDDIPLANSVYLLLYPMRPYQAIPGLLEILEHGGPKKDAIALLALMDDPRILPALSAALRDSSSLVRKKAAEVLSKRTDALPELMDALRDPFIGIQDSTIEGLVQMGAPAVPALIDALADKATGERAAVVLHRMADSVDIDLPKVAESLKSRKDTEWAVDAYVRLARAEAKKSQGGLMLPARIKPPKKRMFYRTRRAGFSYRLIG